MKNIAIVTGASSGIGKEFFLSLKEKTQNLDEIWVIARSEDKLKALQEYTQTPLLSSCFVRADSFMSEPEMVKPS